MRSREHGSLEGYIQEIDGTKNRRDLAPLVEIAGVTTLFFGVMIPYVAYNVGGSKKEAISIIKDLVKVATSKDFREELRKSPNPPSLNT